MEIPKDAREVYLNEEGEPIAYCPKEGLGITDIKRVEFYKLNEERLQQLAKRAVVKQIEEGGRFAVVCINVDDPAFVPLVDALMPDNEATWQAYRDNGQLPIARGVVPHALLADLTKEFYPAAGEPHGDCVNIFVCDAGGIAIMRAE